MDATLHRPPMSPFTIMTIEDFLLLYGQSPQVEALTSLMADTTVASANLKGLVGSSTPMLFAAALKRKGEKGVMPPVLFMLNEAEEAGYFYNDLVQMLGQHAVFFFPSSYKRSVKYGQKDASSEILRTEVLGRLAGLGQKAAQSIFVVTHPEAVAAPQGGRRSGHHAVAEAAPHAGIPNG